MKTFDARFLAVSSTLSALLLLYSPVPVFAWEHDSNAHFGTSACNAHISNPQPLGSADPSTFVLCKRNSNATEWYAEIRNYITGALVCKRPLEDNGSPIETWDATGVTEQSFTCTVPNGSYKGRVYWKAGGNSFMPPEVDQKFTKP